MYNNLRGFDMLWVENTEKTQAILIILQNVL